MEDNHTGLKVALVIFIIATISLFIGVINLVNENSKYNKIFDFTCKYYTANESACKTGIRMIKSMDTNELNSMMKLYNK